MIPYEFSDDLYLSRTRMIVLPDGENRMIVASFVATQYQCVMDRQTDGHDHGIYSAGIASYADAL